MKTNICGSCFGECEIVEAISGWEVPTAITSDPSEASDCCGEEVREIDTDLIDWHRDLLRVADAEGQRWTINEDPEKHKESWEQGLSVEEELNKAIEVWDSSCD